MKALNVGLIGAAGRAGKAIVQLLPDSPEFCLKLAVVSPRSPLTGTVCLEAEQNRGHALMYCSLDEGGSEGLDALIDFSTTENSLKSAAWARRNGIPILICVTGHSNAEVSELRNLGAAIPVALVANTSRGVFVAEELSRLAARLLGEAYDVEIVEAHHRQKKDAPSGTALRLAQALAAERSLRVETQRGSRRRESNEIGIASVRGGQVLGEHKISFLGAAESLEISHNVLSREIFARGALELARGLISLTPGFYSASDIFKTL